MANTNKFKELLSEFLKDENNLFSLKKRVQIENLRNELANIVSKEITDYVINSCENKQPELNTNSITDLVQNVIDKYDSDYAILANQVLSQSLRISKLEKQLTKLSGENNDRIWPGNKRD